DVSKFQFDDILIQKQKELAPPLYVMGVRDQKKNVKAGIRIHPVERVKKLDSTGICPECKNKESDSENIHNRDYATYQQIKALEERVRVLEVNLEKFQILEANLEKIQTLETTINQLVIQQFEKSQK
ncbi:7519_t:CDS:2, partial [Dentiscutata heterogama]